MIYQKKLRKPSFAAQDIRVVMYGELLENANKAYKQYLGRKKEAGEINRLVQEIVEAVTPA